MLYCKKCNVSVAGNKKNCPLCHSDFTEKGTIEEDVFPVIASERYSSGFAIRLISFLAISLIVINFAIWLMLGFDFLIALAIGAAICCIWINTCMGIIQRKHLFRNITWQLFLISAFAVLWDLCTEWHGWSIDYVIPTSCIISMISMIIISRIKKMPIGDYVLYIALDALYGIVPIVFIFTGVLNVIYPSIVCSVCGAISLAALFLFEGRNMIYEIKKKLSC